MSGEIVVREEEKLAFHLQEVLKGDRRFENAAQTAYRMIKEKGIEKIVRGGRTIYDFKFFRQGERHLISWFDELNAFVGFVRDAAKGGSAKKMAFIFVGEPGNGKTFGVEYVCLMYRQFIALPENRRYTFEFINLDKLGNYGNMRVIQSQTFEDPMILAMNLFESRDKNEEYLKNAGFDEKRIKQLYKNYRSLGACTEYIWRNDIYNYCNGDINKMLEFVRIVPVPIAENLGVVTGKYSAGEKITTTKDDLVGAEDVARMLHLTDPNNPYKFDLRRGAIARTAGGGIHFSDEIFKNKRDLINIYLQVIENRTIELAGYRWPIDVLIICTSNDYEYNQFIAEKGEGPIHDRCRTCNVSHNTNYILQQELTWYAMEEEGETIFSEPIHIDPNLIYAVSVGAVLTRLPHNDKLTPGETMKLEAGESAGEKNYETLIEIKEDLNANPDVLKRWGQKGLSHRNLGRALQVLSSMPESHEGKCLFAKDVFKALERIVLDYVPEATDREKFKADLKIARKLYRRRIRTEIYNAYMDDPQAIKKDVMAYINMIIGLGSDQLGPDKTWTYRDPQTNELKSIKIDERYINSVEERMGATSQEAKESHRTMFRRIYGQKMATDPNYDFMDQERLVKAVTDVRLESDVAGAGSLVGALANQTNEENVKIRNRMISTMLERLHYCQTCAQKTIEYYCTKEDVD